MTVRRAVRGFSLAALVACVACQRTLVPNGLPTRVETAAVRTVRGIVVVAGSEPQPLVELHVAALGVVRIVGSLERELRAAQGLELDVTGNLAALDGRSDQSAAARTMDATRYAVRASDGVAALDGILTAQGPDIGLQLSDGTWRALPFLPTRLRSLIGARVFFVGPLDAAPVGYGVLRPPPAPVR